MRLIPTEIRPLRYSASMGDHISAADLERYAMGILQGCELAAVDEHLLVCQACQDALKEVDDFITAMRTAASLIEEEE